MPAGTHREKNLFNSTLVTPPPKCTQYPLRRFSGPLNIFVHTLAPSANVTIIYYKLITPIVLYNNIM